MKALDFSILSGSLVVRKNTVGDVRVSTVPAITICDNNPKVIAIGTTEVRKAIEKSNIKELVANGIVLVVC